MPLPAAWRWTCAGPFFFEAAGAAGPEIGLGLLSAGRLCTDAFVRLEEDGWGNVGDGTLAELVVKKSVADEVGAVRRGVRAMR